MVTVTAVELRKNLDRYIKMASTGEAVRVTYRNSHSVVIGPDTEASTPSNADDIFKAASLLHDFIPRELQEKLALDDAVKKHKETALARKYQ